MNNLKKRNPKPRLKRKMKKMKMKMSLPIMTTQTTMITMTKQKKRDIAKFQLMRVARKSPPWKVRRTWPHRVKKTGLTSMTRKLSSIASMIDLKAMTMITMKLLTMTTKSTPRQGKRTSITDRSHTVIELTTPKMKTTMNTTARKTKNTSAHQARTTLPSLIQKRKLST